MSHTTTVTREAIERAHKKEKDAHVSRRMLLVLKVKYGGVGQNRAARSFTARVRGQWHGSGGSKRRA